MKRRRGPFPICTNPPSKMPCALPAPEGRVESRSGERCEGPETTAFVWPGVAKKLDRLANEVLKARGTETEPDDWIADAAKHVEVSASIIASDRCRNRNQRAYCRTLAWMKRHHYNTNEHFRKELQKDFYLRRRPRCRETEPEDFHAPHDRRGGLHGRDFWPAGNRNVAARGLGDTLDTRDKILLWGSLGLIVGGILLTQVKEEP